MNTQEFRLLYGDVIDRLSAQYQIEFGRPIDAKAVKRPPGPRILIWLLPCAAAVGSLFGLALSTLMPAQVVQKQPTFTEVPYNHWSQPIDIERNDFEESLAVLPHHCKPGPTIYHVRDFQFKCVAKDTWQRQ